MGRHGCGRSSKSKVAELEEIPSRLATVQCVFQDSSSYRTFTCSEQRNLKSSFCVDMAINPASTRPPYHQWTSGGCLPLDVWLLALSGTTRRTMPGGGEFGRDVFDEETTKPLARRTLCMNEGSGSAPRAVSKRAGQPTPLRRWRSK